MHKGVGVVVSVVESGKVKISSDYSWERALGAHDGALNKNATQNQTSVSHGMPRGVLLYRCTK
jgi:hypothetical protein